MDTASLTTPALVELCAVRLEQDLKKSDKEKILEASTRIAVHALRCLPVPTCSLCSIRCPLNFKKHVFTGRNPIDDELVETSRIFCGICYMELNP